jgi:hypothetical protein
VKRRRFILTQIPEIGENISFFFLPNIYFGGIVSRKILHKDFSTVADGRCFA